MVNVPCWRGRGGRNPYRQAHDDAGSGVEDARLACARGRVPLRLAFGMVDDLDMQREVAEAAVRLLEQAREPETRPRLELEWPVDTKTAYRAWQP